MSIILVAMSGGVDSSTTAFKLLRDGHKVIGVTMSMGRKCDANSIQDARLVAKKIGIEHHVLDVSNNFKEIVIDYFINSYLSGETPNPCARCNKFVKFKEIIDFMKKIKADYVATGHYSKIIYNNDKYELHKATCLEKDQSYFLSTLDYDFLQYIIFPLGDEISKENTRNEAKNAGLHIFNKHDSQDVCFIEDNDYKKFLSNNINKNIYNKQGIIQHINGTALGKHNGIINYTIGQRKGLNISYNKPIFVTSLDAKNNIVYVSDNEEDLFSNCFYINNVNVLSEIKHNYNYNIKIRSTHSGQLGNVELLDDGKKAKINLNEKTRAVTKGQLCCIYDNSKVIASGYII